MELRIWHTGPVILPNIIVDSEKDTSVHARIKLADSETDKCREIKGFSSINEEELVLSTDLDSPEKKEEFKKKLIDFITEKVDALIEV